MAEIIVAMQTANVSRPRHSCETPSWIRFCPTFTLVAVLLAGCNSSDTTSSTTSSVPSTDVTKAMVGHWGSDGEEVLIISLEGDQVVVSTPANDMWRMDILDASIVGDSIHFVQKNYLRSGDPHPFNGMACNSVVKMVREDELEFGITTEVAPDLESTILTRIE